MRIHRGLVLAGLAALAFIGACASGGGGVQQGEGSGRGTRTSEAEAQWPQRVAFEFARVPDTIPTRWAGLIGEYGEDSTKRWYTLERENRLWILDNQGNYVPLGEQTDSSFDAPLSTSGASGRIRFSRDAAGRAQSIQAGAVTLARRNIEPAPGTTQLRITPRRPVEELRREALAATPPAESASLKLPDLVDITTIDSTIRLDIRYAGENNFLGVKLYEQPRAFLQRPAAEALARANRVLRPLRYTLLVHDAYRPWYVTKVFWDATPDSLRWLVANPAQGSKHNRGAAVDVTLFDLETGKPVEMPSTYDESTTRARADYPGGTSLQRYHRALLRRVLEHEGFAVVPQEWWHFDYKDWKSYPIGNIPFERIGVP